MAIKGKTPRAMRPRSFANAQAPLNVATDVAAGVIQLLARTVVTALSGVRDVGAEVGSVAVAAVRGSIRAAGEIGGDVGRLATVATEGALEAADRIAVTAGRAVSHLVNDTVDGVKELIRGAVRPPVLAARRAGGSRRKAVAAEGRGEPRMLGRRAVQAQRAEARPGSARAVGAA